VALLKPAGVWTYDDLLHLPDDGRRYEIIEGELYEMPAPNLEHATTIFNLVIMLAPVIQSLGGRMFFAPLDVFFQGANPVEPDIVAVLPGWQGRLALHGPEGAPDFLVEILSPSNRVHDLLTKRALYERAGVREYWIVDPVARTVEVLSLEGDALRTVQTASGNDAVVSPLLDGTRFPLETIFANVSQGEAEG
jgi:Uma2 family endonuclease